MDDAIILCDNDSIISQFVLFLQLDVIKRHETSIKTDKMKNLVRFTIMHGAGNDYIYVDTSLYDVPEPG